MLRVYVFKLRVTISDLRVYVFFSFICFLHILSFFCLKVYVNGARGRTERPHPDNKTSNDNSKDKHNNNNDNNNNVITMVSNIVLISIINHIL